MQVVSNGNHNARLLMKKTLNNWLKVKAAALT
jgi:hypothetical protein